MTCIIRCGNTVAADSLFSHNQGDAIRFSLGGSKLFRHPTKPALIGVSGGMTSISYQTIMQFISQVIFDYDRGEWTVIAPWRRQLIAELELRQMSILIMMKDITIHIEIDNISINISHISPKVPIAIGSCPWISTHGGNLGLNTAADFVKLAMRNDPLVGGKITEVDISNLGE